MMLMGESTWEEEIEDFPNARKFPDLFNVARVQVEQVIAFSVAVDKRYSLLRATD